MTEDDIPEFELKFSYPPEGVTPKKLKVNTGIPFNDIDYEGAIRNIVSEFHSKDEDRVPTNISFDMAKEIYILRNKISQLEYTLQTWKAEDSFHPIGSYMSHREMGG